MGVNHCHHLHIQQQCRRSNITVLDEVASLWHHSAFHLLILTINLSTNFVNSILKSIENTSIYFYIICKLEHAIKKIDLKITLSSKVTILKIMQVFLKSSWWIQNSLTHKLLSEYIGLTFCKIYLKTVW